MTVRLTVWTYVRADVCVCVVWLCVWVGVCECVAVCA